MAKLSKAASREQFADSLAQLMHAAERLDCNTHEELWITHNMDFIRQLIDELQQATLKARKAFQRFQAARS